MCVYNDTTNNHLFLPWISLLEEMILLVITSFFLGYLFGKKRASSDNHQESGESKSASTVTNKQGGASYEAMEVEQKVSLEINPAYGVLK